MDLIKHNIDAASDSKYEGQNRDFLVYLLCSDHSDWNAIFDADAFLYAEEWKLSLLYCKFVYKVERIMKNEKFFYCMNLIHG